METLIDAVVSAVTKLGYFTERDMHFETGEPIIRICNGPELYGSQDVAYLHVYGIPPRIISASKPAERHETPLDKF